MKRVIIAEDEHMTSILFKRVVERSGHEVVAAVYTGEEAVKKADELRPDVAFLDINMEHRNAGIDACEAIKELHPEIKVYFLTAYSKDAFEKELDGIQYDGYIDKLDFEMSVGELLK